MAQDRRVRLVIVGGPSAARAAIDRAHFTILDYAFAEGWEPEWPVSWEVEREAFLRERGWS